ncbi:MAG: hypothetical protein HYZ53_28445, partial [Planctomycetes bacterium]|nr:hypothetical protein [Planctomycetota bacterium]
PPPPSAADLAARNPALSAQELSVHHHVVLADWLLRCYAWAVGLDTKWRMFSPPDRVNWEYRVYGLDAEGRQSFLPLPPQGPRSFWQRNFTDFREAKFELNLYLSHEYQELFAQHLAHDLRARGRAFGRIRIDLAWRAIYGLGDVTPGAHPVDPVMREMTWGEFTCPDE